MVTVYFTEAQRKRFLSNGETDVITSQIMASMKFTTSDKIVASMQVPEDWIKADFGNGMGFLVKGSEAE